MWVEEMPEKCRGISKQFSQAAKKVRQIAQQVGTTGNGIKPDYICPAAEKFFENFNPVPRKLEEYADHLDQSANAIMKIRVLVWVPNNQPHH
jgi:uncharacterized protein YukE